ncbi:MAG: 4Fe-4S dicluster domain-containing protein [Phycisphaerae bacterium]
MQKEEHKPFGSTLAELIAEATGTSPLNCYQCGRCAAGCPQNVPGVMEISPTRIMRLLQLESAFSDDPARAASYAHQALNSQTCWLCAGCQACTTRCPQGVDIAGAMDVLREQALALDVAATDKRSRDIQNFHRGFLAEALKRGRIDEMSLVLRYKIATGHWLQDATVGMGMFRRGKLHLRPAAAVDTQGVQTAMERVKHTGDGVKQAGEK